MSNPSRSLPLERLPPTTAALLVDGTRPYFLWWTTATVGELKEHLSSRDGRHIEVDRVHEPVADVEPPPSKIEGIEVEEAL